VQGLPFVNFYCNYYLLPINNKTSHSLDESKNSKNTHETIFKVAMSMNDYVENYDSV